LYDCCVFRERHQLDVLSCCVCITILFTASCKASFRALRRRFSCARDFSPSVLSTRAETEVCDCKLFSNEILGIAVVIVNLSIAILELSGSIEVIIEQNFV
jgi:hypothetical protein